MDFQVWAYGHKWQVRFIRLKVQNTKYKTDTRIIMCGRSSYKLLCFKMIHLGPIQMQESDMNSISLAEWLGYVT